MLSPVDQTLAVPTVASVLSLDWCNSAAERSRRKFEAFVKWRKADGEHAREAKIAHAAAQVAREAEARLNCTDPTDLMIICGLSHQDREFAHELLNAGRSLDDAIAVALALPGDILLQRGVQA